MEFQENKETLPPTPPKTPPDEHSVSLNYCFKTDNHKHLLKTPSSAAITLHTEGKLFDDKSGIVVYYIY